MSARISASVCNSVHSKSARHSNATSLVSAPALLSSAPRKSMTIWRPINKAIDLTNSIFTIGHSTRSVAELVGLLRQAGIDLLVDVRSVPRSRTNPQFNSYALPDAVAGTGIDYRYTRALGGLRSIPKD